MPPKEVNPGSCGEFRYRVDPNPELFMIDGVKHNFGVVPSLITPNWLGATTFTLTAYYPEFPSITMSVPFTLNVIDECTLPPELDVIVHAMTYTLGQVATTKIIPLPADACGDFVLMSTTNTWLTATALAPGEAQLSI